MFAHTAMTTAVKTTHTEQTGRSEAEKTKPLHNDFYF